jgi:hypothetical protein
MPSGRCRPSAFVYRLALKVGPGTFHDEPDREDQPIDLPERFHTPAMSRRLPPVRPYAEARKSCRGVNQRSDGGARK